MTLDQAVAVGLKMSPVLAEAGHRLEFVLGVNQATRSDYLPKLSVVPGVQDISHIVTEAYVVQATIPIDIAHLLRAADEQSKFDEIAARLAVNQARNDVVFRVRTSFFTALRAQALVRVAEENVRNSQSRLEDAQARYQARVVAYIDVARAETDLAEAKRTLIDDQLSETEGIAALSGSMGVDVTSRYEIADIASLGPAEPSHLSSREDTSGQLSLGSEFEASEGEAVESRPEVLAAEAQVAAAGRGILLARSSELPSLNIGLGYYDLRTESGSRADQPEAYVGLNFPIFDGGLAHGRVREAKANLESAKTDQRNVIDLVSRQVQSAYLARRRAVEQLAVATKALDTAKTAFDLATVRYKTGVALRAGISPLIELSDAQVALTQAEQNLVNAQYDAEQSETLINYSVGRFAYFSNELGGFDVRPDRIESKRVAGS